MNIIQLKLITCMFACMYVCVHIHTYINWQVYTHISVSEVRK